MGYVVAISQAKSSAYNISMPEWSEWKGLDARRVDVDCRLIQNQIKTSQYKASIIHYCFGKEGMPFNKNGTGNQGYLFDLPQELAALFLEELIKMNSYIKDISFVKDTMQQLKIDSFPWTKQ